VIDPLGRVVASLPLGPASVLDSRLPKEFPPTIYARYGDWIFAALLSFVMIIPLARRLKT
jgi:apolipoprotein N-acyltransferase